MAEPGRRAFRELGVGGTRSEATSSRVLNMGKIRTNIMSMVKRRRSAEGIVRARVHEPSEPSGLPTELLVAL